MPPIYLHLPDIWCPAQQQAAAFRLLVYTCMLMTQSLRCFTTVCWPNHNGNHNKALLLTQTLQLLRPLVALRAVHHHCSSTPGELCSSCKQALQHVTQGRPVPDAAMFNTHRTGMHPSMNAHCKLLIQTDSAWARTNSACALTNSACARTNCACSSCVTTKATHCA